PPSFAPPSHGMAYCRGQWPAAAPSPIAARSNCSPPAATAAPRRLCWRMVSRCRRWSSLSAPDSRPRAPSASSRAGRKSKLRLFGSPPKGVRRWQGEAMTFWELPFGVEVEAPDSAMQKLEQLATFSAGANWGMEFDCTAMHFRFDCDDNAAKFVLGC